MAQIQCTRCGKTGEAITSAVYGGKLGEEIKQKMCQNCWNEWKALSIKIINEYRLDLNDPNSDKVLEQQLQTFMSTPA